MKLKKTFFLVSVMLDFGLKKMTAKLYQTSSLSFQTYALVIIDTTFLIFLDSTKLKIVCRKITTFFKARVSIIL